MENKPKHRFFDNLFVIAFLMPLIFVQLVGGGFQGISQVVFGNFCGKESLLYQFVNFVPSVVTAVFIILIVRKLFAGYCNFGFKGGKPLLGVLLSSAGLLVVAVNLYGIQFSGDVCKIVNSVFTAIGIGITEEVICRGYVVSNLMRKWQDKPNRVMLSVIASSIGFGCIHMFNVFISKDIVGSLIQVAYCIAIGIFFGATYVRSRNIWGNIILHSLIDTFALLGGNNANGFDSETGVDLISVLIVVAVSVILVLVALVYLRPGKRAETEALWQQNWDFGDKEKVSAAPVIILFTVSAVLLIFTSVYYAANENSSAMSGFHYSYDTSENGEQSENNASFDVSTDRKSLTVTLPYLAGTNCKVDISSPDALGILSETSTEDKYEYKFNVTDNKEQSVKLDFTQFVGDGRQSMEVGAYTVTVSLDKDGRITDVKV